MQISIQASRNTLAVVWFGGASLSFIALYLITTFGDSTRVSILWEWYLPAVTPNLSLIVGVMFNDIKFKLAKSERVDGFSYRVALWLSVVYLLMLLATPLLSPFSDAPLDVREVNTTRFSLFLPETRAFFLQDAGNFEFGGRPFRRTNFDRQSNNGRPFFSRNVLRAIRTEEWKYVARHPDGPFELYDMKADPRERFNLFGQPKQAEIQRALAARLDEFFQRHADPQYDVWKGGRSKAGALDVEQVSALARELNTVLRRD